MKMIAKLLLAATIALPLTAQAGLRVDTSGATMGMTQGGSDPNNVIGNVKGYYGAQLYTTNQPSTLSFEFVGSEAWGDNWLTVSNGKDWGTILNHPGGEKKGVVLASDGADTQKFDMSFDANSLIGFSFMIDEFGNGPTGNVANGSNGNTSPNFWVGNYEMRGDEIVSLMLALDDGGDGFDGDSDDLVVKISVGDAIARPPSEVPIPAAAWLFGSALIGLIGINRKRKTS